MKTFGMAERTALERQVVHGVVSDRMRESLLRVDLRGNYTNEFTKRAREFWLAGIRYSQPAASAEPVAIPAGWHLVPLEPTEEMWGGLARDIIMAWELGECTPSKLFSFLRRAGRQIPRWMSNEPEMQNPIHVPSKGTRACLIYRAFLDAAPPHHQTPNKETSHD